jgi:hypothetical protein
MLLPQEARALLLLLDLLFALRSVNLEIKLSVVKLITIRQQLITQCQSTMNRPIIRLSSKLLTSRLMSISKESNNKSLRLHLFNSQRHPSNNRAILMTLITRIVVFE